MAWYRIGRWLHVDTIVEASDEYEAQRQEQNLVDAAITKSVHMRSNDREPGSVFMCHTQLSHIMYGDPRFDRPVTITEVVRN